MHTKIRNHDLVKNAKSLRKNATGEEKKLWYHFLATLPVKFTRQKVINRYIVDFCCVEKMLVIELDGAQHYEDAAMEQDKLRDAFLEEMGYTVLRYTDKELNANFQGVCKDIYQHLGV